MCDLGLYKLNLIDRLIDKKQNSSGALRHRLRTPNTEKDNRKLAKYQGSQYKVNKEMHIKNVYFTFI